MMQVRTNTGQLLEFPEGTPLAAIQQVLDRDFPDAEFAGKFRGQSKAPPRQSGQSANRSRASRATTGGGFTRGLKDPLDAASQMLAHAVPDSWERNINQANNWLIDKGLPLERLGEGGLDALLQKQESAYQAQRAASGESGIDGDRLLGNIASPMNLAIASKIPTAINTVKGAAGVMSGGGLLGAMHPVYDGDFATEKAKQVGTGAALAPAAQLGFNALGRMINPNAVARTASLRDEGVTPTIGQAAGGWISKAEEKAMSVPLLGDAIAAARTRGVDQFNRAAINRALNPIGKSLPKYIETGAAAVKYVKDSLGDAYKALLPKLGGDLDAPLMKGIETVRQMGQTMIDVRAKQLNKIIDIDVIGRFTQYGKASGETLNIIESKLSGHISQMKGSADGDQRSVGKALEEVQRLVRDMIERNNPGHGGQLASIRKGYANYAILRKAASGVGAKDGVFTPAQLGSAVKAGDKSAGKGNTATGKALMQDLSDTGQRVLSNTVPNSGTIDRMLLGGATLGTGGYLSPPVIGGLLGGATAYLPGMSKLMQGAITARPAAAKGVAEFAKRLAPYSVPGIAPEGYGLLQ